MQQDTTLIRARSLARRYTMGKEAVIALNGVDLDIRRGEFVALVGPSGSGKSTLLNLIGGLDRPSSGEIWVEDLELGKASDKRLVRYRRDRIGFIFQSFNLLATRSAVENVEVPLMLAGQSRKPRHERALRLLEQVGLAKRANHKPNELSGGEMQRVAIARALANNPILLLADEPTGNLDSKTGKDILNMLRELLRTQGLTMVLVTHDMNVAHYADRIVHLLDGGIQRIETAVERNGDFAAAEPAEVAR
jgi:putative ABC transport system ATP-binding protein